MHDLLEKMGKRIVREESPTEPGKRSRLWHHEDVYHVLTENTGTKKIRGIVVKLPKPDVMPLNAKSFLRMVNLEIFINRNAHFSGCVDYLPNDLRWIQLGGDLVFVASNIRKHTVVFNLPSNYHPRHLVRFDMPYSGIRQLNGFKNLVKLRSMNLRDCEFLEKIPDLSGIPNIEYLNLSGCKSLVEVDDSIGFLDKLVELNLSWCFKLKKFASRLGLRSLEMLLLGGCSRLESFPEIEDNMKSLRLLEVAKSGIRALPSSIAYLTGLKILEANGCENLTNISICGRPKLITTDLDTSDKNCITLSLPNLDTLNLNGCNISESDFLVPLDCWFTLTELDLSRNNFVSLPDCISKFVSLRELRLTGCKRLREIPQVLPPQLIFLYLMDCTSLEKIPKPHPMLWFLNLTNCFGLSGVEVAKLENNWLNEESLRCSELNVILPGSEIPKWISYTSHHSTTIEHLLEDEFCFEIPLHIQGKRLLGLALFVVLEPPTYGPDAYTCTLINGIKKSTYIFWNGNDMKAAHVRVKLVNLDKQEQQGDICQVIFQFPKYSSIKSCGVHRLLRNQDERLHLSLGSTSSLGMRPRPRGSSDIMEYDQQQQWPSLSLQSPDGHPKRGPIDLNVPFDVEQWRGQKAKLGGGAFRPYKRN